jgi:superfamily II DNA or RNA helicase
MSFGYNRQAFASEVAVAPAFDYAEFLARKSQSTSLNGFKPIVMPNRLMDFQAFLVAWAIEKGRGALLTDCGTGKSFMELVWAENVLRHTNKPVLILTPLAVGPQMVAEGQKFGIECVRSRDGAVVKGIVVTNYEKLHLFSPSDFAGVVCDESSILKHFAGATQKQVTRFLAKVPYRLLGTATAAPNDYIELGTASEALGELGYSDMLARFFKQSDNKPHRMQQIKQERKERIAKHFGKLSFRVSQGIGQWRLKGHAETPFWRWVASWARACRKPSDLGFSDAGFDLPELIEQTHIIMPERPRDGMLFTLPAVGLNEEREERRRTLDQRCAFVAELVAHDRPAVVWCHLNVEGDLLAKMIPGSRQVKGADSDDEKEESYRQFATGETRVLVIKPKIGAWGLNWQHCNHVVTFASHSYEQFYQSVRRCWRYGQTRPVTVDIIATEGERAVSENMTRKAKQADEMFARLVSHMHEGTIIRRNERATEPERLPTWL